jgi:hypothetical protein
MTRRPATEGGARAHRNTMGAVLLAVALVPGCALETATEPIEAQESALSSTLDPRRSLAVTDQAILARFSLKRVMDQLVSQSRVNGLTSVELFHQWWDTLNPKPGLGLGPHCDDTVDATLGNVINGFPYTCRPAPSEGAQASCDPFAAGSSCAYIPIGLFNRFDLMPENGAYCGEYRIVYAKASGVADTDDRNLLIFEMALPNPLPLLGIEGCRPAIQLWADLSNIGDINERANRLEQLYFQGILVAVPPIPPVVHVNHLGAAANGRGQIRTNQFVDPDPRIWSLREFKIKRSCGLLGCSWMRLVPQTNKGNPWGGLFNPGITHPKRAGFETFLAGAVPGLLGGTLPEIGLNVPDAYNSALSEANGSTDTNYAVNFGGDPSALRSAIGAALAAKGSSLTADNIVARVQAQSCAGCHRLSNSADLGGGITWPPSLGFTHITERETEVVSGSTRYLLSPALNDAFLPHRQMLLQKYIDRTLIVRLLEPLKPIGGFLVH